MKSSIFKRILTAISVVILVFVTTLPTGVCFAPEKVTSAESYQPQIDAAKKNRDELKKKKEELEAKIRELTSEKEDLEQYVAQIDAEYTAMYDEYEKTGEDIAEAEKNIADTQKSLEDIMQKENEQYETMKLRVKYMYENGEASLLDMIFGNADATDVFNRLEYRQQITKYDNELLVKYNETKLETIKTEELYTAQLDELNALKEFQKGELEALEEISAAKSAEIISLADNLGVDEEMLYEYWDELKDADADIARLQELEKERLAEEERKRKEEEERLRREREIAASRSLDNIIWPLPNNSKITSYFGYRKAPTKDASTYHKGIDISANTGTDVLAAIAGTVVTASYSYSSGNYIVIDHGNGVKTTYCHASKLLVKAGDEVKRGQVIMKVGSTGVSTGAHLHFGITINGTAVDPLKYVSFDKKLK